MSDFLFRGGLSELDPELGKLADIEAERQYRRLILIPSESSAPLAVRQALASAFQNLYAEGYPDEYTRDLDEQEILSLSARLARFITGGVNECPGSVPQPRPSSTTGIAGD